MNTLTQSTPSNAPIPNVNPTFNSMPVIGFELSLLAVALFGLIKALISQKKSEWEASQTLIEDLKDSIKQKDEELEDSKDEILLLKAQLFRLQKQNKNYESAFLSSGLELQTTSESNN